MIDFSKEKRGGFGTKRDIFWERRVWQEGGVSEVLEAGYKEKTKKNQKFRRGKEFFGYGVGF